MSVRERALALRAAQRAYMADRGNERLGLAVGQAAMELDEALFHDSGHQSRVDSFMEALTNVAVGFAINFTANWFVLPAFFDIEPEAGTFFLLGAVYTVISVARSYLLRRAFNGKTVWQAIRGAMA